MKQMSDRDLAIGVMDHRRKFSGSSFLFEWWRRYGDRAPEDVFPDLKGWDVDEYYEHLKRE